MQNLCRLLLVTGFVLAPLLVYGVTVHTWMDGDGVRHFSDAPPTDTAADTAQFEIAEMSANAREGDDYYSISNQWKRIREERLARETLRVERARARAEAAPTVVYEYAEPRRHARYPFGFFPTLTLHALRSHGFFPEPVAPGPQAFSRRSSVVHATPPQWPRNRFFAP